MNGLLKKKIYFRRGFQRKRKKIIKIVIVFFTQSIYICIQKAEQDNRMIEFAGFLDASSALIYPANPGNPVQRYNLVLFG